VNGGLRFGRSGGTGHLSVRRGVRRFDGGSRSVTYHLRKALRTLLLLAAGTSIFAQKAQHPELPVKTRESEPSAKTEQADASTESRATEEALQEPVSPWDWSATLRGGVGYKDNILLSDFFKESSIFTFTEADFFFFRVPTDDAWEFTGVLSGQDRRFWQSDTVEKEQFLLTSADVKKGFGESWKVGLGLQYFYNDQIFDASVAEGLPFRVRAKLHRISGGPSVQYKISDTQRLEWNFNVIRQEFGEPLDDSWEFGPKILFGQKYGDRGSEFTTSVQFRHRSYDTRSAPGEDGKSLAFEIPELEVGVKHYWDADKEWMSRVRAGLEINRDNGHGAFDFDYRRWKISKEVDFTRGGFEGMLQAKFLYYEYLHQTIENAGPRRRTELVFSGRARKEIMKRVFLFGEAEHEWVMATDFEERYHATTVWGGIEWEVK
jgi:hypothetical protein